MFTSNSISYIQKHYFEFTAVEWLCEGKVVCQVFCLNKLVSKINTRLIALFLRLLVRSSLDYDYMSLSLGSVH